MSDVLDWLGRNLQTDWSKDKIQLEFESAFHRGELKNAQSLAAAKEELDVLRKAHFPHTLRGRAANMVAKPLVKSLKAAGWTAAAVAVAGGLFYLAGKSKKDRKFDHEAMANELETRAIPVLAADALAAPEAPVAKREVVGNFTQKYLAGKGGIDPTSPNILGPNNLSTIDGRAVEDLKSASPSIG